MMRTSSRQTNIGGLILTFIALILALGVVIWLIADTPLDGGAQVATDPPAYKQITDKTDATVTVSPNPKGGVTADTTKTQ
ncbi:hypothetical protein [uncultured Thioclava sp.]|uniref:hypothetical protein n=1 Tax=uncultured Thioclava sp. TaxID=473858 RepID=UPI0025EE6E88|nr:hypothetical protein [uncultured Thioclava sp.]